MNDERAREKYKDLDGMKKAVSELLGQAWTRGYKCGELDNKIDPSFVKLDQVKDWNICGFRLEDLVLLACNLRENGVDDIRLQDYNKAFKDGYMSAVKEINEELERSVNKIIGGDNN